MFHRALWLYIFFLIGSGVAADVPFVFDARTSEMAGYTPAQLEQASVASLDLVGIPSVSTPSDKENLDFPITGGGDSPEGKIEKNVGELKKALNSRVEPDNPFVHREALSLAAQNPGDYTIEQVSAIYSYLKENWHYVRDPRGIDYLNYANESLAIGKDTKCVGAGDCDDFAILMSALVESVGGTTRIILARNTSMGGHAYAEVYLGQLNAPDSHVYDILDWLMQKFKTSKIFAHIETETNDVWLNLDWGRDVLGNAHPGGPFYQGDIHYVLCIRDLLRKTPLKVPEGFEPNKLPVSSNLKTNSKEAYALNQKSSALYKLVRNKEALEAAEKAVEIDPNYAVAWVNMAAALLKLGRNDEALQASEKAIVLDPNYAIAWNNKAAALDKLGRNEEALEVSEKTIDLDPNFANPWITIADVYRKTKRYDESLQASEKAIEIDPQSAQAWVNKAAALLNLKRNNETLQASEKAIEIDAQSALAWVNKAAALLNLGRYEDSLQACDKAIVLDSKNAIAWNNKGYALYKQGKFDEAVQAYNKCIELDPKYEKVWNNMGTVLLALNRGDEADAAFARASELS